MRTTMPATTRAAAAGATAAAAAAPLPAAATPQRPVQPLITEQLSTRRELAALALAAASSLQLAQQHAAWAAAPPPPPLPPPLLPPATTTTASTSISPELAAAFLETATAAIVRSGAYGDASGDAARARAALQQEVVRLRRQEERYYLAAAGTPAAAGRAGGGGGDGGTSSTSTSTSSTTVTQPIPANEAFDFETYLLWKAAAERVRGDAARAALVADAGAALLARLLPPDAAAELAEAATSPAPAPGGAVVRALERLVGGALVGGGYAPGGWLLVLGDAPGSWGADWAEEAARRPVVLGDTAAAAGWDARAPLPPGFAFQLRLSGAADLRSRVALRGEEGGFSGAQFEAVVQALLARAGYPSAAVDSYVVQDRWRGPPRARDRLLLLLGDPLQAVDVPFLPSTQVTDWVL